MCQCMICNCWWVNYCGVCAGWHHAYLCCSYWLCKPVELMTFDPELCHCFQCDGIGSNHFCFGSICCAPPSVRDWSHFMTMRHIHRIVQQAMPPGSARAMVIRNPNNIYIG